MANQLLQHEQTDVDFFETIYNAIKNDDSHQEYLDPIYFTVMKDPVVISSGCVLDRASVIDKSQKMIFKTCPMTRKDLKNFVYPVNALKSEIIDWTKNRFTTAISLAKSFHKSPE